MINELTTAPYMNGTQRDSRALPKDVMIHDHPANAAAGEYLHLDRVFFARIEQAFNLRLTEAGCNSHQEHHV